MSELVYEAMARALGETGIGAIFGLMGEETAKLTVALDERGEIPYYSSRHESGAIGAADGYARATGGLGVCLISRGPGYTNALTAMIAARKARSRVLVIAADTAVTDDPAPKRYPKHIEQTDIAEACGLISVRPLDATDVVPLLHDAARQARGGKVVILNVPTNVFDQPAGEAERAPAPEPAPAAIEPSADDVAAIADALTSAEHPLVIVGRGALGPGGREAVREILSATGALVGTSAMGKDAFAGHEANIGIVGGFSHDLARSAIADVDAVVAFGASLNNFTLGGGKFFRDATVLQVALDAVPTSLAGGPDRLAEADAPATARAVADELARRGTRPTPGWDEMRSQIAGYVPAEDFEDESTEDRLDPRLAMCALNETLPANRTVTTDGGHFAGFPATYLAVPDPRDFILGLDYSAVGMGFGSAIGVAIARPDATNVLVIGDGGLLMTMTELDTVSRERIPLVIVVVNDAAYGAELQYLRAHDMAIETSLVMEREFDRIAAAFDIPAMSVRTLEEAREAGARAAEAGGPMLIDMHVNQDVCAEWMRELFTYGR